MKWLLKRNLFVFFNNCYNDVPNNVHGLVMRELGQYFGMEKSKLSRQGDGTAEAT